jgi:hypothetical protein
MGRSLIFGMVMCAVLLVAATTRSDVVATSDVAVDDAASLPEPISGAAVQPAPSDQQPPPKDPFAPYDVGPPESIWPYESLTPAEQAVIDRGRNATEWDQIHNVYATAVKERSRVARADAAQHLLGLEASLDTTGVVP